jgi:DNA-binding transcriptional LysR family regulator
MAPTPRAVAIWPAVREALRQLQASLIPSEFVPAEATLTFVLAMADATAASLIPGLNDTLEREAPGIALRVIPLTTRDPRQLLDEESCDLADGHFPSVVPDLTAKAQSGETMPFLFQRLYDGEYVCVMRKDHPLASGPFTLGRYCSARHMLVSFSGRPYGFIDESLAALGRERRVVLTVNQFFTAGRVVANSNLLTVLPHHFVQVTGIADQLAQRPLPFKVSPVHVDALWHRRSHQRSAHMWLRQAVTRAAEKAFSG